MKTSIEDTFISRRWYNLAETVSIVPRSRVGSFHHARKSGREFADLEFVDDPSLRVLIDVQKGDKETNISTAVGKASFLRSRIKSRPEVQGKMHVASFFQDGLLRTNKSPDPKYLPSAMGGTGAPALFDEPMNIFLYVHSYRGGDYSRIYASASREAQTGIEAMEISDNPASLKLCNALRMKQLYLHATYDEKVAVPGRQIFPTVLPEPLYLNLGSGTGASAVEQRLLRTKHLIGRKGAEVEFERKIKFDFVVFGCTSKNQLDTLDRIVKRERAREFNGALQSNTAFMNLINRTAVPEDMDRLMKDGFSVIHSGEREFMRSHAEFIAKGARGLVYSLMDLTSSEDMFLRSEVSCEESLKIPGIPLIIRKGQDWVEVQTKVKIGLYEIGKNQLEWAEDLSSQLEQKWTENGREPVDPLTIRAIYYENREWVTDDTLIVSKATEDTMSRNTSHNIPICIVSTDLKLANKVAHSTNRKVVNLHPTEYYFICKRLGIEVGDEKSRRLLDSLPPVHIGAGEERKPGSLYVDTGSLAAHLSKCITEKGETRKVIPMTVGVRSNGSRFEKFKSEKIQSKIRYLKETVPSNNKRVKVAYSASPSYRQAWSETSDYSPESSYHGEIRRSE